MEKLNNYKYSYSKTIGLKLSEQYPMCLNKINVLAKQEGYKGKNLFNNEIVLNLDCVAKKKAKKGNIISSMDFTIITEKNKEPDKALLVDFKLNAKSGKNINKDKIKEKLKFSRRLLSEIIIHEISILIYNKNFVNEANSMLRRLFNNKSTLLAISITEFNKGIFSTK